MLYVVYSFKYIFNIARDEGFTSEPFSCDNKIAT